MNEKGKLQLEDVKFIVDFLKEYGQEATAVLIDSLHKDDAEMAQQLVSTIDSQVHKTTKNENELQSRSKPIKEAATKVTQIAKDSAVEVKGYAQTALSAITSFWKDTVEKGKEAIQQAKEKIKELGRAGGEKVAQTFSKGFNKAVIANREFMIYNNKRQATAHKIRINDLEKVNKRINKINERTIILKSAFVRNPEQYRAEKLAEISDAKNAVTKMIDKEQAQIDSLNLKSNKYREDIAQAEVNIEELSQEKTKAEPTLDEVLDKAAKEVAMDKKVSSRATLNRDNLSR